MTWVGFFSDRNARINFKKGNLAGFGENGPFCRVGASRRFFLDEKVAVSRPCARLAASTEITRKNRESHRVTETFTPSQNFFLERKNDPPPKIEHQKSHAQAPFPRITVVVITFFK